MGWQIIESPEGFTLLYMSELVAGSNDLNLLLSLFGELTGQSQRRARILQ
jgi:hypothetical protein